MDANLRDSSKSDRIGPSRERAEYVAPKLQVYGGLGEITGSVGNMGAGDGGSSPMHKTSS